MTRVREALAELSLCCFPAGYWSVCSVPEEVYNLSVPKGLVIVPAFNEEAHISETLARIKKYFDPDNILVVDDGSADGTAQSAREAGVRVISFPKNQGKGAALNQGFETALAEGFDFVITIDADGQHPPERIPEFLAAGERFDLIIGSRRPFSGMPTGNWLSNRITTLAISLMIRKRLEDSQCGYRLIRTSVLRAISPRTRKYQAESELLVKAAWRGFKIGHVPIEVIYKDEKSHIRALDVPRAMILAIWLLLIRS